MSQKNDDMGSSLPPRLADRLLEQFCAPYLLEEVQGDMYERFHKRAAAFGEGYARRQYWLEVLGFLRPVFRKKESHYSPPLATDMIRSYFLTAFRQMKRQVSTTTIYISGLTLGIVSSLIIYMVIRQDYTFDRYHTQADRIYRVETVKINPGETSSYAGTPSGVAAALRNDFPEIEKVAIIEYNPSRIIGIREPDGRKVLFEEPVAFAGTELFSLFDYRWVTGSRGTALTEPFTALLTESTARKLFGLSAGYDASQLTGKTFWLDNKHEIRVEGILQDPPANTDFGFPVIISFATLKSLNLDMNLTSWGGWGDFYQTYALLRPGMSPARVESRFPQMVEKYKGQGESARRGHKLLPLKEIHFDFNFNQREADPDTLYALGLIGAFLLLIACINFVNLATAQAIRRSKEVGVRKVLGSTRGQLVRQFLSETALITFAAVTLAVGITLLVLPYVPQLLDVTLPQSLLLEPDVLSFLAAVFVSVSIVSGIYPAWVLSGYKPVLALKNRLTGHPSGGVTLRRGMVTFQFAVAQLLIIGTAVVAGQMRFFGKADLGFDKEAILTVALPDNQPDKLRYLENQLKGRPEVKNISFSFNSASAESNAMGDLHYKAGNRDETIRTQFKFVDLHFMDTYGIRLLAGEPLGQMDLNRGDSAARILVNQVFLRRMGLRHPAEAVGKTIHNGDQLLTVIGVVADFHVNSLLQQIDPTLLMVSPREYQQAAIKLQPGHTSQQALGQVIARLGQVWAQLYPDHVFRYQFLDEALAQAYHKENKTLKLLNVFAAIAILISCLGIYGLVSFMAVQRTKEVGIRKILGASVAHIVYLFSKEFVVLILVAFLIAAPVGYYLMNSWLQAFQFRISLGAGLFLLTVGLAVLIALLTVSFQSVKAALANPVKSLRNE